MLCSWKIETVGYIFRLCCHFMDEFPLLWNSGFQCINMSKTSVHVIPLLKEKKKQLLLAPHSYTRRQSQAIFLVPAALREWTSPAQLLYLPLLHPSRLTNTILYSLLTVSPMLPCLPRLLQDDGLLLSG